MQNKQSKRFAGYVRVSGQDQRKEGYSLDAQKNKIIEYCNFNKFELINIYEDAGISGSTIKKRPSFKKLLEDAKNKKFDGILVFKFDRAFRNLKDAVITLDEFRKINIDFISITENIDTTTAMGNAMFGIIGVFAQLERDLTSERMDSSFWQKFNEGKSIGKCPTGYKWNKKNKVMEIDTKKAEMVKEIFKSTIQGISYRVICSKFNLKPQSYYNIIRNPVYAGFITFEGLTKVGVHEAIVSISDFKLLNKDFVIPNETP
mgnify:CR=1 FL=1